MPVTTRLAVLAAALFVPIATRLHQSLVLTGQNSADQFAESEVSSSASTAAG